MKSSKPYNIAAFLIIVSLIMGFWVYLFIGSVIFFGHSLSTKTHVTIRQTPSLSPTSKRLSQTPTAINIPKIHKNLPIKSAMVHGNNWDMFGDAVAWLSTSALPGKGNVILYAHDWTSLWADLYLLKPGDSIEVQQGNVWKKYKVSQSLAVDEHDIQAVLSNDNRLTLYTCEGTFDQKRRVVYAVPI